MTVVPEPRIRVLPAALADQIAAGEVVERPASVVKELCENSLDADARRIEVDVEAGGRRLIRVADDGCGMTGEEARLALRRHATSKLTSADELWGLGTFGFRGEALPSIAAVARLTLRTRIPGTAAGFRLDIEGGRETDSGAVGMPDGTQIEVRDLFHNTPARLKFLKSEATEAGNVTEAVMRLALGHPEVHFKLRNNGRVVLDLPPQRDLGERVRAALARRGGGLLHEARGEEGGHQVTAYLGSPAEAPITPRSTFLFVGRRFVRDRSLLHALALGYGDLLEKGRYPMAALFLEVPGQDLDINVHPQKLEVRFARAQEVYAAVRHVVAAAVARAPWRVATPSQAYSLPSEPALDSPSGVSARSPHAGRLRDPAPHDVVARRQGPTFVDGSIAGASAAAATGFFSGLTYIGHLQQNYLVCEGQDQLVLIDKHAAHERIVFEQLKRQYQERVVTQQRLLFPIPIALDEATAASAHHPDAVSTLAGLGFDVESFGPGTVLLRSVPDLLKDIDPKPLLLDVLLRLPGVLPLTVDSPALDGILAAMACQGAVRAGDVMAPESVASLLAQLDTVDLQAHCPHGPVLLRLPMGEIERRFGRN